MASSPPELNILAPITHGKAEFRSLGDAWADITRPRRGRLMLTVLGLPAISIPGVGDSGGHRKPLYGAELFQYSSRCWPPRAAATQAMNAPTSIDKAVKIERYAPALRAESAACRAFISAAFSCAITSSTRFTASAWDSPV
jgi:hypothetical protein